VPRNYLNRNGNTLYCSQKNIGIDGGTTLRWTLKRSRMGKRELHSSGFGLEQEAVLANTIIKFLTKK